MPSFLNKLASRWNNNSNSPKYGPIGPIPPRDTRTPWRQRLARLLGSGQSLPLRTASYRPVHQAWFHQPRDLPPFTFQTINSMLLDPGIRLNLAMRAAPVYGVQFAYPSGTDASGKTIYQPGIQARNPAVAAWVARQLSTIWHNDLPAILRSQVYGWAGGEVALRFTDNSFIEIDRLVARHPGDVRLLQCEGRRYGVKVLRVQDEGDVSLQFPAAWFHAFRPDDGEDYGTSILLGAYSPWADKWFNGGALDTRRLFMHKDAYGGMKIAYPEEDIYIGNEAVPTSARDIAAQMVEQRKAGGTITYPSTLDMQGNPKWRIEEATTANNPQHILQYPKDCDDEIRIGMEIPDDVISNDGSGAWAGKRIPLAAFYASLDTWVVQILADLRHTLEPLIMLNWGRAEDFEICHKPLALQAMEQQGQAAAPPDLSAQAPATTARRSSNTAQPPDLRAQPPITTAQAVMLSGSSPHRMSLNTRRSLSHKEQADRYQRAHLMAALLTRIYGPEAERYFDEAFGTNLHDTNSTYSTSVRHPHEFQRMSSQISRSVGLARIPWDPLKHPRGRDGRFIEKYGIDAFTATQSQINATLDPNANPSRGRVSDDIRPLLEHLNILDDSQLHNLASDYEVRPDQTSKSPFADAIHHQIYGEEPKEQDLPYSPNKKPQYRNAVLLPSDGPPATVKLVSTNAQGRNNDNLPSPSPSDKDYLERAGAQRGDSSSESNDGPLAKGENVDKEPSTSSTSSTKPNASAGNADGSKVNNTLGVEDVPADFEPNKKWNSPGEKLSAYIRSQHNAAFDLADQIIQTRDSLFANSQARSRVEEALKSAVKGSRNEQDLQAELRQLNLQHDILERQEAMFTERLNTEYADLQLPGFSVEIGFNRQWTIPGGVGGQAVLDRAMRDLSGYGTASSEHPDEHEVFRHGSYGQEPEVNGVPTMGFEDLPEHVKNYNNKSEGKALSNYTRNQHATAFQLADQIIDSAQVIQKAEEEIAQLQTELQQANSESAKQEVKKRLDWARSSNEIRKGDTQKLVDELHQKHGNVVIPSFRYDGVDGKSRVAGGIGAEAIIARALRDRDGYGATHLHNNNASVSQYHAFDFDIAGGIARRLAPGGRELIDKLVENSKKLTTRPVPQSGETVAGGDTQSKLPIPKASRSQLPSEVKSQKSESPSRASDLGNRIDPDVDDEMVLRPETPDDKPKKASESDLLDFYTSEREIQLIPGKKWYHGTDVKSAEDILANGLSKQGIIDSDPVEGDKNPGFFVTDRLENADNYAISRSERVPEFPEGTILEYDDADVGKYLIGHKDDEAVIPFDAFDKIPKPKRYEGKRP